MSIGWTMVLPIYPVTIALLKLPIAFNRDKVLMAALYFIFGVLLTLYSKNYEGIYNLTLLAIILLYRNRIENQSVNLSLGPPAIMMFISIVLGIVYNTSTDPGRYAFYGGEINFTAFTIIMFSLLLIHRGKEYIGYIGLITAVGLTLSRAALITSVVALILTKLSQVKGKIRFILYAILTVLIISFLLTETKLFLKSNIYNTGMKRLLMLNDTSLSGRLDLTTDYGAYLISDINYILLGVPNDKLDHKISGMTNVVHNSYVFKSLTVGVLVTMLIIYWGFRILPRNVFLVLLLYSFSLHALLSPALFLFLSLYFKKGPD